MSSAGATLQGSFSGATGSISEAGFLYGTTSGSLETNGTKVVSGSNSSPFATTLGGLSAGTKYFYKAYVCEYDKSAGADVMRYGEEESFTTFQSEDLIPTGWLELPGDAGTADYVGTFYGSGTPSDANRNYSYNYSYQYYSSLWVAYPLTLANTKGSVSTSSWTYNDNIPDLYEVNIVDNSYPTMYQNAKKYSRGHQVPNADRKNNSTMNKQTYITTNQTPQIQDKFNGSIWGNLETAIRGLLSGDETIYIVTGPAYRKVGGNETISYLTGASDKDANPTSLPLANYYWKAILRVKQNENGEVLNAIAIGFWFEHKEYESTASFNDPQYIVSVNQIEEWTGFDLFANLPNSKEAIAESNTSWTNFQKF